MKRVDSAKVRTIHTLFGMLGDSKRCYSSSTSKRHDDDGTRWDIHLGADRTIIDGELLLSDYLQNSWML